VDWRTAADAALRGGGGAWLVRCDSKSTLVVTTLRLGSLLYAAGGSVEASKGWLDLTIRLDAN
jgi:hypothetical protein